MCNVESVIIMMIGSFFDEFRHVTKIFDRSATYFDRSSAIVLIFMLLCFNIVISEDRMGITSMDSMLWRDALWRKTEWTGLLPKK